MLNISGIILDSLSNGDGLRSVIFFQGCYRKCYNCQNPHTHELGKGENWSEEDIFNYINDKTFSKKVTFSGGEPLLQNKNLTKLAKIFKDNGYNIWLYTGYTFESIYLLDVFKYVDVVVDGEYIEEKKVDPRTKYKGSTNQRIIHIIKREDVGNEECLIYDFWNDSK